MILVIILSALIGAGIGYWIVRGKLRFGIAPSLWVVGAVLVVLIGGLVGVIFGFGLLDGPGYVGFALVVVVPLVVGAFAGRFIARWLYRGNDA